MESIAIIGMGCRFPGGANNIEQFWDVLKNAKDVTSDVPKDRWYHPRAIALGKPDVPGRHHKISHWHVVKTKRCG